MNALAQPASYSYPRVSAHRSLAAARLRRERVLAALAFAALIMAWDATLRLDERVSPARLRMAHAVAMEAKEPTAALAP